MLLAERSDPLDALLLPEWEHYEFVDGELREKEMGFEADAINIQLSAELAMWARGHGGFHVAGSEASFRCFPNDPRQVRRPDTVVVAKDRFPPGRIPAGHITFAPDVVVEVVSPNDKMSEVRRKVEEYVNAGVRLIWVLDPETQTVEVHGHGRRPEFLRLEDELTGGDVLPGFTCPIANIFGPVRGGE